MKLGQIFENPVTFFHFWLEKKHRYKFSERNFAKSGICLEKCEHFIHSHM